jgi:hypothetical protein
MRLLAILLLSGAVSAAAGDVDLYQWTDADGIVRYTTDPGAVPRDRRGTLAEIAVDGVAQPPLTATPSPPAPALATPAPTQAPAEAAASPAPEEDTDPFEAPLRVREAGAEALLPPGESRADRAGALDARIRALELEIGRDEEALKDLLSGTADTGAPSVAESPELLEIAHRLPGLQAELRGLKAQRAELSSP